jgi:hypothetical protein
MCSEPQRAGSSYHMGLTVLENNPLHSYDFPRETWFPLWKQPGVHYFPSIIPIPGHFLALVFTSSYDEMGTVWEDGPLINDELPWTTAEFLMQELNE